jgi:ubiquinone/menaquinone biosynthesis C-methylase UbiE
MQEHIWEKEYRNPTLISLSNEPIKCLKDFVRFIKKDQKVELSGKNILDLGCGNGKNSIYIAEQGEGNTIHGIDISQTAINLAKQVYPAGDFQVGNIGSTFPYSDNSFDIVLDITSSNSLTEKERSTYLTEISRTLKPSGHFYLRTLCKDGDTNAKNLLISNPGKEKDTYIMPELGLTERVFSKEDLIATYSPFFELLYLDKEIHYTKFNNRSYKRNFWVGGWRKGLDKDIV